MDASQIGNWLRDARKRARLTQHQAAHGSGVGYGVVTSSEQGRAPELLNFLRLVVYYGAEKALLTLLQAEQSQGLRVAERESKYDVNHSGGTAPPLPVTALKKVAGAGKSGEKKRRA